MTTTRTTTSGLVPVTKHGVMTAAPGHKLHVVLAHRAEQVPAEGRPGHAAALAMITPDWPGSSPAAGLLTAGAVE